MDVEYDDLLKFASDVFEEGARPALVQPLGGPRRAALVERRWDDKRAR